MRFTKLERPIGKYTMTGEKIKTYLYIHELVEEHLRIVRVRDCCQQRLASYKGFTWRYE